MKKRTSKKAIPLKLYLAHPFDSREKVRAWELSMEKKFPMLDLLNPLYNTGRTDTTDVDEGKRTKYDCDPSRIVIADLEQISKSGGLVAVIDESRSYGTIMEIAHAFLMNKPVYIIVTNGHIRHPWLQFHANQLFESYQEFERYCSEEFREALKELKANAECKPDA
jgi:nucleoside 2-deoxyribosyltransferase